ncbi:MULTISPECIES: IDEAL domain-containing protein [Saccharibacillus]|uniref:IDEAL domain-containing protein n=1 Tax=Saccharibacillus brassicae TaxID=2583377 RepID=A0A4Y6UX09_SACBS|nr:MULTISPECIES: IDEAL domain-containing protein [Saccharibacillus]MWJ32546.1 IDEAL domain-containing protein [Saccharibacillus sp. WB 17]QDH21058.1 IDEAL domain-containing protein [Saccharibacillus brassicae]
MSKWTTGDWIQAYTDDGALVHGYLIAASAPIQTALLQVTHSDNKELMGKEIAVSDRGMKKLSENPRKSEQEIRSLIDLALQIRDEAWFTELTNELRTGPRRARRKDDGQQFRTVNRLGSPDIR